MQIIVKIIVIKVLLPGQLRNCEKIKQISVAFQKDIVVKILQ